MARMIRRFTEKITVPPEYWTLLQSTLEAVVARHNDIASQIEAHQRLGKYDAERLLDQINGEVREARQLLEAILVPI